MNLYDVHLIESTIIEPMLGRKISRPTLTKWRRLAGIEPYCRFCDEEKGLMLVAVAHLRMRFPTKPLSISEVICFRINKYDDILETIKGCNRPSVLRLAEPSTIKQCIDLIAERGRQHISEATLRRWCHELEIHYSNGMTFTSIDVERLIDYCNKLREERVIRGKSLAKSRVARQRFNFREAV